MASFGVIADWRMQFIKHCCDMSKYKALVFDWDGTLMDSVAKIVACCQAAAADMGLDVPSYQQAKQIIGLGLNPAMAKLFNMTDETQIQAMADRYRFHYLGDEPTEEIMFEGVTELLNDFENQGYYLAVATGKSRRGLDHVMEKAGLTNKFHVTRCADETFSKPHPQMLLEIIEFLGIEAHQALMIGDTEYDMQMAVSAGADGLGVTYGVHDREHLLKHGALTCLDDLRDMSEWLNQISN